MQIVTDSGVDLGLTAEQRAELNIHIVPLVVTLDGKSYREGVDLQPCEFYPLLAAAHTLPITSQPSPGDFAQVYRRLAQTDPVVLSIHMSSGLSGTFNSARVGAASVPEAQVTFVDTKTLSVPAGWQVEAAAYALRAGWSLERVLALVECLGREIECVYTLQELKYLIHGGRIGHMKGLVASVLNIKPLISVEKAHGTYVQVGQARAFNGAVKGLVDFMARKHRHGSSLRTQVMHSHNPEGAALLSQLVGECFDCHWQPTGVLSLVLGAHVGPSMVAVGYAPQAVFADIPY